MSRPPESSEEVSSVTRLLHAMRDGDESAGHELLELVYGELRGLAGSVFKSQTGEHTLQPTALVHEAWIKMSGNLDSVEGKRHFLSIAAKAMRQVLIDHARSGTRQKRGGHQATLTLMDDPAERPGSTSGFTVDAAGLHECLNTLARAWLHKNLANE